MRAAASADRQTPERGMTIFKRATIVGAVMLAAACSESQVPAQQMAQSQSAIRAASEVGAENYPQAALHLKMAKDREARAEKMSRDGDNESAKALLEESQADAELALALARKQQAEASSDQAKRQLEGVQ
jgi:hypothetical protein